MRVVVLLSPLFSKVFLGILIGALTLWVLVSKNPKNALRKSIVLTAALIAAVTVYFLLVGKIAIDAALFGGLDVGNYLKEAGRWTFIWQNFTVTAALGIVVSLALTYGFFLLRKKRFFAEEDYLAFLFSALAILLSVIISGFPRVLSARNMLSAFVLEIALLGLIAFPLSILLMSLMRAKRIVVGPAFLITSAVLYFSGEFILRFLGL